MVFLKKYLPWFDQHKYLIFPVIFAGAFLVSCSKPVGSYGTESISEKEYFKWLDQKGADYKTRVLDNKTVYLEKLYECLSNKVYGLAIRENQRLAQSVENDTEWKRIRGSKVRQYLSDKSYTPPEKLSTSVLRDFLREYEVRLFFIEHNTGLPDTVPEEFTGLLKKINESFDKGIPFEKIANRYSPMCRKNGKAEIKETDLDSITAAELSRLTPTQVSDPVITAGQIVLYRLENMFGTKPNRVFQVQRIVFTNDLPESLNKMNAIQKDIIKGLDFATAANLHTSDTNNFTYGAFPTVSRLSPYFQLLEYLDNKKPGDVVKKIPVDTGYVYVQIMRIFDRSKEEVKTIKNDPAQMERIAAQMNEINNYQRSRSIIDSGFITRNYAFIYDQAPDLSRCIVRTGKIEFTLMDILKRIGAPESINIPFQQDTINRILHAADTVAFRDGINLWYENYTADTHDLSHALSELQNEFLFKHYDRITKGFHSKELLFVRYPVEVFVQNMPRRLFAEEINAWKDQQKLANKGLLSRFRKINPEKLKNAGEKKLLHAAAAYAKHTDNAKTAQAREKSLKNYEKRADKADKLFEEYYNNSGWKFSSAIAVADIYFTNGDLRRSREWFVRSGTAVDYVASNIIQLFDTSDEKKQWVIVEAMGYMRNPDINAKLKTILTESGQIEMRCFAIEALGKIRYRENIPLLMEFYSNEVWGVRLLAGQALEAVTGEKYPVPLPDPSTEKPL